MPEALLTASFNRLQEEKVPKQSSPEKRAKTNLKRQLRNATHISRLKSETKKLRGLTDAEEAAGQFKSVASLLDKAGKRGNLHPSTVSRNKSRLARHINKLAGK
jgi:small subunit ribosomal protein S20